jgi:uncharacterized protein YnzC (UPF0291/DUF896 family)
MVSKEKIDRINYLARKSKVEPLTEKEKLEQKNLRKEYLENFRRNFKMQLENIKFVDNDAKN